MEKFLNSREVISMTGLSKSSIYRLMNDKLFPQNIPLSPRRVAWDKNDVVKWMEVKKNGGYEYWD